MGSRYATPVGSVRIDFETLPNDHLIARELPPGVTDSDIQMVRLNDTLVNRYVLFERQIIFHLTGFEMLSHF